MPTAHELTQEHVVRIERPSRHYTLLRAPNGDFLATPDGAKLEASDHVDDAALWQRVEGSDAYRHVVTGLCLSKDAGPFIPGHGPAHLPSEYLRDFKANGWVCLPSVLSPEIVEELEKVSCTGRWSDRKFDRRTPPLNQSSAVAKTATEPVSLWLMRRYLQTDDIRLGHAPSFALLGKDDGKRDVQGWHSDFPYLWGITSRVGGGRIPVHRSGEFSMGVQRNICVSEFTRENGATCFKLGSHTRNSGPPREWGTGSDYSRPGHRAEHGLPYHGPEADVVEAPPGSIILYDARTWHRAGVNRTEHRRAAMLQAVIPMYIMPFMDTSRAYKALVASPLIHELTEREQAELEALMVHKIVGPAGQHAIGVDEELTRTARER